MPIYLAYVNEAQAFEDIGVWVPGETATITGNNDPEEVRTLTASRGVLTTLACGARNRALVLGHGGGAGGA